MKTAQGRTLVKNGRVQKTFEHRLTLQLVRWYPDLLVRELLPTQLPVRVKVSVDGRDVTICVPAINFDLSLDGEALEGFVSTVPGTNLPKSIWPQNLTGYRFTAPGKDFTVMYAYTIGPDGSLTISRDDGTSLPAIGQHRINATSFCYQLPRRTVAGPENVKLSSGLTNVHGGNV